MPDRDREFLAYYDGSRVEDQITYYEDRADGNGKWNTRVIVATGVLMFVATVSSFVVAARFLFLGPPAVWEAIATLIPALAAAIAATRNLYEYEKSAERFTNTALDLRYLNATQSPSSDLAAPDFRSGLVSYVEQVEDLLASENRSWVELMALVVPPAGPEGAGGRDGPPE